jgi:hypothetical protein
MLAAVAGELSCYRGLTCVVLPALLVDTQEYCDCGTLATVAIL